MNITAAMNTTTNSIKLKNIAAITMDIITMANQSMRMSTAPTMIITTANRSMRRGTAATKPIITDIPTRTALPADAGTATDTATGKRRNRTAR